MILLFKNLNNSAIVPIFRRNSLTNF